VGGVVGGRWGGRGDGEGGSRAPTLYPTCPTTHLGDGLAEEMAANVNQGGHGDAAETRIADRARIAFANWGASRVSTEEMSSS